MIASAKADEGNMRKVMRVPVLFTDQRSGTLVTARPDEQFAPNNPIFSTLPPASRLRCGNDEFAFGTIIPQAWRKLTGSHYRTAASLATPI
jgi:hypothetical protein